MGGGRASVQSISSVKVYWHNQAVASRASSLGIDEDHVQILLRPPPTTDNYNEMH
jgi:hypothetical protein